MKRIATLVILIGISVPACQRPGSSSAGDLGEAGGRDRLVGWFEITGRETIIPVFKADGTYYSVCRNFEIPLKECPEGLEWAPTSSSMAGTTIGFDEASNAYYIIIEDQGLANNYEPYISGEKQPMTRIDKPSGLLDATAQPPRTNDDFLGWYQPLWLPVVRFEIRKDGDMYLGAAVQILRKPGVWETWGEPCEITPLPDRLGFSGFDGNPRVNLAYNEALKRFELTKTISCIIRMPLVRVSPLPSPEGLVVAPPMKIGIPSWH
ncbi:MAG: hypothetical protein ACYS80_20145 [Planctomycetota bacterium]